MQRFIEINPSMLLNICQVDCMLISKNLGSVEKTVYQVPPLFFTTLSGDSQVATNLEHSHNYEAHNYKAYLSPPTHCPLSPAKHSINVRL